jgi:hypothetical protein
MDRRPSSLNEKESFVHLCQPDVGKSCSACCGIYNYADSTRESLVERFRRRTRYYRDNVRNVEDATLFSEVFRSREDQEKLYEVIYCCEYVGFLDDEEKTVGCLLHPLQCLGVDLRDLSFYGRELCDGHFCPSYTYLSREEKLSLIQIIDDWYLYGLCVTDIDLVKEYFRMISDAVFEMPAPRKFMDERIKEIALRFFNFKVSWPYRSPDVHRFGKYYFDGSQYMIHHIDYERLGCEKSRFDKIFLSLCSEFGTAQEVADAERMIQGNIDEFVRIYGAFSQRIAV